MNSLVEQLICASKSKDSIQDYVYMKRLLESAASSISALQEQNKVLRDLVSRCKDEEMKHLVFNTEVV